MFKKKIRSAEAPICQYTKCLTNSGRAYLSKTAILGWDIDQLTAGTPKEGVYEIDTQKNEVASNALFKSCHHCFTFYCSSICRELDWPGHKQTKCYYGNLASLCKRILTKLGRNVELRLELSKVARTAYLSTAHRGFIWLNFNDSLDAQMFMHRPLESSGNLSNFLLLFGGNLLPRYVTVSDPVAYKEACGNSVLEQLFNNYFDNLNLTRDVDCMEPKSNQEEFHSFNDTCSKYDPLNEFLLLVSVSVNPQEIATDLQPRKENPMYILKFMKMKLLDRPPEKKSSKKNAMLFDDVINAANTLILTNMKQEESMCGKSVLETEAVYDQSFSKAENRELFLANIICNFEERGINIRVTYPKIYSDLCRYVDEGTGFAPVCLFPRDMNRNNLFMCLIMPNSEPANYAWFYDYDEKEQSRNKQSDTFIGQKNQLPSQIKADSGSFILSNYMCVV